jgi:hypothetical protein
MVQSSYIFGVVFIILSVMQDSDEQAVGGKVEGEEDQVHRRAGAEGAEATDRCDNALGAAHSSSGVYSCFAFLVLLGGSSMIV